MQTEPELDHPNPPPTASSIDTAAGFWSRVQEHKIIQWGLGYLGAALALAHGQELVAHSFHWSDTVGRIFMIGLIAGFPIALTLAWYHGHRGLTRISAGELTIVSVLVLIGAVFFTVSLPPSAEHSADAVERADPTAIGGQPPVVERALPPRLPNSIAVLPFDNLSPDENNAFFAAGIHDEVLNQLGKLKSLNVIARTSVMQYANAARPITEIALELNVETVMEGSVSYADDRVAVRAKLIDAETGVNLWSDSYNREFKDIIAIQADIAMNIANALEAEFSDEEQARIEQIPTASSAAYALYLEARAMSTDDPRATALLEQATAIDPQFAAAHAYLARLLAPRLTNTPISDAVNAAERTELEARVRRHASRALELDAKQGTAHAALGVLAWHNWHWTEAEAAFTRAIEASPPDWLTGINFANLLTVLGRHEEAIALGERIRDLDPDNPQAWPGLAQSLGRAGNLDAADALLRRTVRQIPDRRDARLFLAYLEIARGKNAQALQQLEIVDSLLANNRIIVAMPALAYGFARAGRPADARRLFDELAAAAAAGQAVGAGDWAMAYLAIGEHEQSLKWLEVAAEKAANHEPDPGFASLLGLKTNRTNDPVVEQPEFVEVLARIRGD